MNRSTREKENQIHTHTHTLTHQEKEAGFNINLPLSFLCERVHHSILSHYRGKRKEKAANMFNDMAEQPSNRNVFVWTSERP